ncbi:MAG: UDP-N-acetylmuramoyl-tripeptide--D-alanyl-D-alanine ligase [Chromatiales bacterium]|jgi:UDP-N-acetylmuramoyl-tripeptide--D-alanyl-D-alanine ligase
MISFSVSEAAGVLGAKQINGDARFDRVSSDTRTLEGAVLFVAIPGERFDGHDYVAEAAEKGAVAALVDHEVDVDLPQIICSNVVHAFGELALAWRERSDAHVVALTGSNGKTTVKEMLARIFAEMGSVLSTLGNLNNNIGVPLTLTRLQEERYAVIEMGANHAGEIHDLSMMTRPDVALLNNAGRAHLEGFGSEEGVARAKAEILYGLKKEGVFVCHGDSKWLELWKKLAASHRMVTFGEAPHCDVRVVDARAQTLWDEQGFRQRFRIETRGHLVDVELPLAGRHNVMNAAAAIAVALESGVPEEIAVFALKFIMPVRGRLFPLFTPGGLRVIDDSYNANPDSVAAAMHVLTGLGGNSVMVLGDMAELGDDPRGVHQVVGRVAKELGIQRLYTLGPLSEAAAEGFGDGATPCQELAQLVEALKGDTIADDIILVKGSRSARMERVVDALVAEDGGERC